MRSLYLPSSAFTTNEVHPNLDCYQAKLQIYLLVRAVLKIQLCIALRRFCTEMQDDGRGNRGDRLLN
ncbi:hypothetical protein [Oscillatoria salina]|uniref:hypothetical protein n=1 Tax=Oscillatoria salina TaxID=331517 RepID=UPI0013BC2F2C|nr:hypothetical protein [Oscillatoria salina]MBZ8179935.1 hypothetical protein [Oscillatoria salina IIICB1]NET91176.1 hypothetical protein [Kamptonema sp. SIO1D9]